MGAYRLVIVFSSSFVGLRIAVKASATPGSVTQRRVKRPRPLVCRSAMTSAMSGAPSSIQCSASSLVEPISSKARHSLTGVSIRADFRASVSMLRFYPLNRPRQGCGFLPRIRNTDDFI
jgi:hypothetical protein